jgi:two-component system, NtrC family, nitrogen regulation sensor histidine kinase NtrY
MASKKNLHRRPRSAFSRTRFLCFLLALPALVLASLLFFRHPIDLVSALLLAACLLLYFLLVATKLLEGMARPLQTLSNVLSSLREGDYSFRARAAGTPDALGELSGEVNSLADLLQKQRVRSLEATALLARILEVMNAPLFAFDRDGLLQLVNNAGTKLLGLSQARCYGRSARELGLEELLVSSDQTIHTFKSKQSLASEPARWLLRKADFRQDGAPHTLLLLDDVSRPLQAEEQTAWKRLVRVLGHEISNSLTPIKSIAGSLLMRVNQPNADETMLRDLRRGLGVIESRADALNRFAQSYRSLAQLPPPRLAPVSLGPLLKRVVLLEQRLEVQLDPGPSVVLNADADQLEQMFINLLANAIDASLANDSCMVRLCWQLKDSSVLVMIEDCGLGIANSDNLFVPFYTTKPSGSGVGLALAQRIARAHDGEVTLVNRENTSGARATIRLPIVQTSEHDN